MTGGGGSGLAGVAEAWHSVFVTLHGLCRAVAVGAGPLGCGWCVWRLGRGRWPGAGGLGRRPRLGPVLGMVRRVGLWGAGEVRVAESGGGFSRCMGLRPA